MHRRFEDLPLRTLNSTSRSGLARIVHIESSRIDRTPGLHDSGTGSLHPVAQAGALTDRMTSCGHIKDTYTMATGKITALRFDRGFGFISPENAPAGGSDVFFHNSSVASGSFDDLREGDAVEFEVQPDPRDSSRSRAANVKLVTSGVAAE